MHRFVFFSGWLVGMGLLMVWPGFEAKGFIFGMIIGYWPFALRHELEPYFTLAVMFVLAAAEVYLCAWVLDWFRLSRRIWFILACAVMAGIGGAYIICHDDFEWWQYSLAAFAFHPDYELQLSDFYRLYLIPKVLVYGVYGIYFTEVAGLVFGAISRPLSKR